jgi:hypothetical protein
MEGINERVILFVEGKIKGVIGIELLEFLIKFLTVPQFFKPIGN